MVLAGAVEVRLVRDSDAGSFAHGSAHDRGPIRGFERPTEDRQGPLLSSGLLLGAGLGAFVDGIVLRQLLQWHNMLSSRLPPIDLVSMKVNMTYDGLFHAFAWVVTGGGFKFIFPEGFGAFYDFQAASLLQGRLDVAEEGIGNEAFIYAGKYYGYFGLTPALMRLPLVIFDVAFGNLSRAFMLIDYTGCLIAAHLLLRSATTIVRGTDARPTRTTSARTSAGRRGHVARCAPPWQPHSRQ